MEPVYEAPNDMERLYGQLIPRETSYAGLRYPKFLDKVRVKAFADSFPLQLAHQSRGYGLTWNEDAVEYARKSFDMKHLPNAVRLMTRSENEKPETIYYVISFQTKCEGEIWKGGGHGEDYEPTTFTQRRQHKVATVASMLGEQRLVLLTDLEYVEAEDEAR